MLAIDRKLVRDLQHMPGQTLAISLVMACGVAVLIMAVGTLRFLRNTRDAYYDRYHFAQVFASVKRAPLPIGERIREIPGVAALDLRIVDDVVVDLPGTFEADEILAGLRDNVSRPTVFRTLRGLLEAEIIRQVRFNGRDVFVMSADDQS